MDMLLLGITVVSLIVAFIMSVTAMRLMKDEKKRAAARVAALSVAAGDAPRTNESHVATLQDYSQEIPKPAPKAPWSAPKIVPAPIAPAAVAAPVSVASAELPLNQPRIQPERFSTPEVGITHASGFLGAGEIQREEGGRQKTLAFAAVVLFLVLSGGLVWMMSSPRGTTAQAMGPNSPLELVSLTHQRQNAKLAVSGLVRNPANGKPIEKLSAVVFLFDKTGTFVTSSRANVDFLRLGAGDESPFVVSLDAPATVARYRVSFRTDQGIVPHIDRRGDAPVAAEGEQPLNVSVK